MFTIINVIINIKGATLKKRTILLFPETINIFKQMGEKIKLARLRRNLSVELVSERANISRATLWSIEKGSHHVAIGYYDAVLHAFNNMDKNLFLVAKDDELGRTIQDLNLKVRKRAKKC